MLLGIGIYLLPDFSLHIDNYFERFYVKGTLMQIWKSAFLILKIHEFQF